MLYGKRYSRHSYVFGDGRNGPYYILDCHPYHSTVDHHVELYVGA